MLNIINMQSGLGRGPSSLTELGPVSQVTVTRRNGARPRQDMTRCLVYSLQNLTGREQKVPKDTRYGLFTAEALTPPLEG